MYQQVIHSLTTGYPPCYVFYMPSDLFLLLLTLVAAGVSCAAAAISSYSARKNNVGALRADVAEMLDAVDKIARDTRSAKMQRVRSARDEAAASPPPEFKAAGEQAPTGILSKAELRRRALTVKH